MIPLTKISDEVYVATEPIVRIGAEELTFLKERVHTAPRKRVRICAHRDNGDSLHEMLIAISRESYIHPHKHLNKTESFHVVEGEVDVAIFDDAGNLTDVVELGPPGGGHHFFYRMHEPRFHTLNIRTETLIVHETTKGPFDRTQTVLAAFAPGESEDAASRGYARKVRLAVEAFLAAHRKA